MRRRLFSFAAVVIVAGSMMPSLVKGEEPPANAPAVSPKKGQKVFVEVCVAEVSLSKLKALGFDFSAILSMESDPRSDGMPQDVMGFLEALSRDSLARVVSRPRLATMSGRSASLQIGDAKGQGVRLNVVPHVRDSGNIRLEYRIELNVPPPDADGENPPGADSAQQFVLASATELEPGKACCVSETRSRRTNERGKLVETATVVLLRADLKPPREIRTAEKRRAPLPDVKGLYPDIEVPQRR